MRRDSQLVGRDAEQRRVGEALEAARRGHSAALRIEGEPGVGKTALLDWAEEAAHGFEVWRVTGTEPESDLAFAGLSQLLAARLNLIDALPEPQAGALRAALALAPGPRPAGDVRFGAGMGLLGLFGAATRRGPILLRIDDAQWLDSATAALLSFACRRLDSEGVAALVAARTFAESPFAALPLLALEGLDRRATERLLARSAQVEVASSVAARAHRDTAGNPLALIDVATTAAPAQLAGREPLDDPLPVGDELRRTYEQRLARLPPSTRRALVVLAADAGRSGQAVLRALARWGLSTGALEPAERAGMISMSSGTLAFHHPLVRAACYGGAPSSERRAAHALLAELCDDPDGVAWHRAGAVVATDEAVADLLSGTARRAQARGAHHDAARAWAHAARISPDPAARARRQVHAATELRLAGDVDGALVTLDAADPNAADDVTSADAEHLRAAIALWRGDPLHARDLLVARAERLEADRPDEAATAYLDAIFPCVLGGEAHAALAPAARAARVVGDTHPLVALARGIAATEALREREGRAQLLRAATSLDHLDPVELADIVPLAALALGVHGELDAAHRLVDRLVGAARERAMPGVLPFPLAVSSILHCWTGSWDRAGAARGEAVAIAEATGHAVGASLVLPLQVEASRGHDTLFRDLAERAEATIARTGGRALRCWLHAARGRLDLTLGRPDQAAVALEAALSSRPPGQVPEWLADLAEAYDLSGRPERADQTLATLRARVDRSPTGGGAALVATAQMRRAGGADLDRTYEHGLAALRPDGSAFVRARLELTYGERLRREKRLTEARPHLRAASDRFAELGTEPWHERAARELRASGGHPPDTGRGTLAGLTPQERKIAHTVAAGATNKEVAAHLVLSPRTVAYHLSNCYRKLGVRSRADLTRLVVRSPSPD